MQEGILMRIHQVSLLLASVVLLCLSVQPALAKSDRGYLVVHVSPPQTYIYADGEPVVESRGHYIILTAGEHQIDMYNYGYKPETRKVTIRAHKWWNIRVEMQPIPGILSGPWGCITLEGAPRAAVLLNGKDPAVFFVGHGDEFDNEWGWHQELIVPPGKHVLTLEYLENDPWTTTVDVQANQRVVVDAYKGVRKTVAWERGEQLKEQPRFHAGLASARVVVEKVKGEFAASTGQVNCGDSAHLTWHTTGAGEIEINGAPVSPSGDQTVQPKQSTDYKFRAAGPGGVYTSDATLNVNTDVTASLKLSPTDVRYHAIGDKVDQPASYTLNWSADNADSVIVNPLGNTEASGSREITFAPSATSPGPVDETVTYTLRATNACGGSKTLSASVRATGSIDPEVVAVLTSIYFPTDWPTTQEPGKGLVSSQEERLGANATAFKQYLQQHPDAKLILSGYADVRGSSEHNQALSQRRDDRVKSFLVEQGIPEDRIETSAFGSSNNLTAQDVLDIVAKDPEATEETRQRVQKLITLFGWAYNRRVDIGLSTGATSERHYPFSAEDVEVLLNATKPTLKRVEQIATLP
jgi:outer membrane protein OmpA-like peptidoglycan-associated protein